MGTKNKAERGVFPRSHAPALATREDEMRGLEIACLDFHPHYYIISIQRELGKEKTPFCMCMREKKLNGKEFCN